MNVTLNYTARIKPGYFLASSLKYFIVQQWSLLLREVNKGDVLVNYLQKRTEFSGGLAYTTILIGPLDPRSQSLSF